MFIWYWIADLCEDEGSPFVLGHALYRRAIHGGRAKNDRIDSHKIAALLRGGLIPQAYVYPRRMRATRDLLRRRNHLMHKRAELSAHIRILPARITSANPWAASPSPRTSTASSNASSIAACRRTWPWTWPLSTVTIRGSPTWSAPWPQRQEDRQCPSQMGILRSGGALSQAQRARQEIPHENGNQTWQGQGPVNPGPQAGTGGLLHAQASRGIQPTETS
jgi:hypothetical protein